MKNELLHDFFLGFVRIYILYHASQTGVYGMGLMKELARHGYQIGPGTVYPILHGMERKGFLTSDKEIRNGKVRKYYRITAKGKSTLAAAQDLAWELVNEIHEE